MRLPEAKIKEAILHPELFARDTALAYFAESFSRDPAIMPLVIQATEKYGRDDAFGSLYHIRNLVQTEATVDWLIRELARRHGNRDSFVCLSAALVHTDPQLLQPRLDDILKADDLSEGHNAILHDRIELLSWDAARCWGELERIADDGKNKDVDAVGLPHAHAVAEALARQGEAYADRILELLAQKIENYKDNPMGWLEIFLVILAGMMRLERAVPQLLVKMGDEGGDIVNDEARKALIKIGTEDAARQVAEQFPTRNRSFRLYGAEVLGRIYSDANVARLLDLLAAESDYGVRANLGAALMAQLDTDAVEPVRKMDIESTYDRYFFDLREDIVGACVVMDVPIPELDWWAPDFQREDDEAEQRMQEFQKPVLPKPTPRPPEPQPNPARYPVPKAYPVLRTEKRVGRNDPCPCSSGKKFKHCCLRKE